MRNRRKTNEFAVGAGGLSKSGGDYVPYKSDLFELLGALRYKTAPAVYPARESLESAKKARREFERRSKTWRSLRRTERNAEKELQRIEVEEQERWNNEITECRTELRLHGVTPALVERIHQLVYGDE